MRRVLLAAGAAAALLAVPAATAAAATSTEGSTIGVTLCPDTTSTWYPQPPGDSPAGYDCGSATASSESSSSAAPVDLGTFCTDANPLGAWTHVGGANGEGVPGAAVTVTIGTTTAASATGPSGIVDFPVGSFAAGTYPVVAVFAGATLAVGPDTVTYLGSEAWGTVHLVDCRPPLPARPGCGLGDRNHLHSGPANGNYAFYDSTCPREAPQGH